MKIRLFLVLLVFFWAGNAAATSVWMVRHNDSVTYLGGTCHVLRKSDYPLPREFSDAYADSAVVVFEADPGQLSSPEMQQALIVRALYADGRTIEQVLRPETYRRLQAYCNRAGLQLFALERLKPPMLALTMLSHELKRHGVDQGGVDMHFYNRAMTDGKRIDSLESMEQQLDFIFALGEGDEDRFIAYTIADLEKLADIFDGMIDAWREGNEEAIATLVEAGTKRDFPEIYRTLFVERNAAWLPDIEKYLGTPETELVLVGVGHLVGDDGLIEALRRQGYEVSKVE